MGRSPRADRAHAGIAAMIAAHKRAGLSCGEAPAANDSVSGQWGVSDGWQLAREKSLLPKYSEPE
jgi:hypothetical protein